MDNIHMVLTPEEDEEFAQQCHIRASAVVSRLVGEKYRTISQENTGETEVLRRAIAFQEQYMYLHPELLKDDCEPVAMYVMALLHNAGLMEVYNKA